MWIGIINLAVDMTVKVWYLDHSFRATKDRCSVPPRMRTFDGQTERENDGNDPASGGLDSCELRQTISPL